MLMIKNKFIKAESVVAKNAAISTLCKPISMIVSYLYVPIALNYLGVEKYGVWATILSILSWIGYFDIGIGNGLRNKLTESISKKDGQSRKLVSSAYAFIALIMVVIVTVFSLMATFVDWNKVFGVSDIHENLTIVIVMSGLFVSVNFILSICNNVLYALQKAAVVSVSALATQILNLLGILIAMRFVHSNLFVMTFVYGCSMLTVSVVASFIIYKKNENLRPSIKEIDIKAGKSITSLGMQFFVIQICALVLFTTDSLIISYLYGAADVTPYNTVNMLFNVIIGVFTALIAPVWSNVTKLKTERNYDGIKRLIRKLQLIMIPFVAGTILLVLIFRPLTRLWLGLELAYTDALIVFGAMYCLLTIWCNTYAAVSNGMEIMKISMFFACIQATVNIPLSLFMARTLGFQSAGVLGGTCGAMMIAALASPIIINIKLKYLIKKD